MVPILLLMSTSACATVVSRACPHLTEYSAQTQLDVADELAKLPDGSLLANVMMPDYGTLRDEVRACNAVAIKR